MGKTRQLQGLGFGQKVRGNVEIHILEEGTEDYHSAYELASKFVKKEGLEGLFYLLSVSNGMDMSVHCWAYALLVGKNISVVMTCWPVPGHKAMKKKTDQWFGLVSQSIRKTLL